MQNFHKAIKKVGNWITIALIYCSACSFYKWQPVYQLSSPDKSSLLSVEKRHCFADCEIRVILAEKHKQVEIGHGSDCLIKFAHAVWEEARITTIVETDYCHAIESSYNLQAQRSEPFQNSSRILFESVRQQYRLTEESLQPFKNDVFEWIKSSSAFQAFLSVRLDKSNFKHQ